MTKHLMDKRDELAEKYSDVYESTVDQDIADMAFCKGFDAALEALSKQGVEGARVYWVENDPSEIHYRIDGKDGKATWAHSEQQSDTTKYLEAAPCIALIDALKAEVEELKKETSYRDLHEINRTLLRKNVILERQLEKCKKQRNYFITDVDTGRMDNDDEKRNIDRCNKELEQLESEKR